MPAGRTVAEHDQEPLERASPKEGEPWRTDGGARLGGQPKSFLRASPSLRLSRSLLLFLRGEPERPSSHLDAEQAHPRARRKAVSHSAANAFMAKLSPQRLRREHIVGQTQHFTRQLGMRVRPMHRNRLFELISEREKSLLWRVRP